MKVRGKWQSGVFVRTADGHSGRVVSNFRSKITVTLAYQPWVNVEYNTKNLTIDLDMTLEDWNVLCDIAWNVPKP